MKYLERFFPPLSVLVGCLNVLGRLMEGFDCQTHFVVESVFALVVREHKLISLGK